MTPFGHASVSFLAGKICHHLWLPAIIFGGILPDLDFLFLFHPAFNQIHRLFTHNLLFIGISSLFIGIWSQNQPKSKVMASLFCGGILHLLADACIDSNPSNGIGVPLFWPFYDTYFSPINLTRLTNVADGWRQPLLMIKFSFYGLFWELPLYFLSFFMCCKSLKRIFPGKARPGIDTKK